MSEHNAYENKVPKWGQAHLYPTNAWKDGMRRRQESRQWAAKKEEATATATWAHASKDEEHDSQREGQNTMREFNTMYATTPWCKYYDGTRKKRHTQSGLPGKGSTQTRVRESGKFNEAEENRVPHPMAAMVATAMKKAIQNGL